MKAFRQESWTSVKVLGCKVTNPGEWSLDSWVSDGGPHLAYDLMTALAYDFLADV
jgi:hypothetical protein